MSEQMIINEQHDESFDEFKKSTLQLIESATETNGIIVLVIEPQDEDYANATMKVHASSDNLAVAIQILTKETGTFARAYAAGLN
jgi:predicted N-formylglutamate amidohydrolase